MVVILNWHSVEAGFKMYGRDEGRTIVSRGLRSAGVCECGENDVTNSFMPARSFVGFDCGRLPTKRANAVGAVVGVPRWVAFNFSIGKRSAFHHIQHWRRF